MNGLVTRSLGFNGYQLPGGKNELQALNSKFDAGHLSTLATDLASAIGAEILGASASPFEPVGASATLLIGQADSSVLHLDKSHLALHTYVDQQACHFRFECDMGTCGEIDPIECVASLLDWSACSFATVDYRVRGIGEMEVPQLVLPTGYCLRAREEFAGGASWLLAESDPGADVKACLDRWFLPKWGAAQTQ